MSCRGNGASNFDRKKKELLNVNIWKSSFINLWREYGTFKTVDGIECFDYYDIDGDGEGQRKMSILLKQPTLWEDTMDDDLDWVHLIFGVTQLVELSYDSIDLWLSDYKSELEGYTFDRLSYVITNNSVISYSFSLEDVVIDDPFLNHLAFLLAERKNIDVSDASFDALVTLEEVKSLMDEMATFTVSIDGVYVFTLPLLTDEVQRYLAEEGVGTDILDELVTDGILISVGTSSKVYAFPVEVAQKMSGFDFVQMVENVLNFDYKVDSHWYDFFFEFIKLILAAVAAYFQLYSLALSLALSFAADATHSEILSVLSSIVSIYNMDITSLTDIGVSEAAKLLSNVYGLYMELSYTPDVETEEEPVNDDQEMFYKAPYSAYNDLYCYESLTKVSVKSAF